MMHEYPSLEQIIYKTLCNSLVSLNDACIPSLKKYTSI